MVRSALVLMALFVSGCGLLNSVSKVEERKDEKDSEYSGACESLSPEEVSKRTVNGYTATERSKRTSLQSEQNRAGASPLKQEGRPFYSLKRTQINDPYLGGDPYPRAVPIFLDDASRANHRDGEYSQFHGWTGARTVYETEAGSKRFFIVDQITWTGPICDWGSACSAVVEPNSFHSWHSKSKNELLRAIFEPQKMGHSHLSVCGCSSLSEEVDAPSSSPSAAQIMAVPEWGFFFLPSTEVPTQTEENMKIQYFDESIHIEYVPKKGKQCREYPVPC